jgi:prolyl-tRNA editing enzyme YbaK/EbsC (Cys-tRNA(Pro) deacylase)
VMARDRIVLGAGSRHAKVLAAPAILSALGGEVVTDLAKSAD